MNTELNVHWSTGNMKLRELADYLGIPKNHVVGWDLPAGWSCPAADICLSKTDRITGKITDYGSIRCYAANIEAYSPQARKAHWRNYEAVKGLTASQVFEVLSASIPKQAEVVRIHASGDFFSKRYFQGWVKFAQSRPDLIFFGYTKVLPYVKAELPENMSLVYSFGGKMDGLVTPDVPVSYIVQNIEEALARGLTVGCPESNPSGDFDLIRAGLSFALPIHGTQPAKKR